MTDEHRICDQVRDEIAASISADAIGPGVAEARRHLEGCAECRSYLKQLREDDRLLADFAANHEDRVSELRMRALAALPDPPVQRPAPSSPWAWITASASRRTAAIAALAATLFLVVFLQGPDASFDAWAEVVESVRKASSASFSLRDMGGSDVEARQVYSQSGTSHLTYEDGELVEALFVDFQERELVYMAYPLKTAARMTMDEAMAESFREHDPARTFDFLQEYEYEDLGGRRIGGRRAAGIRITDARFLAQRMENAELELWVDPESKLPLRFDVTGEVDGRSRPRHVRFYDFRWNEPLAETAFRPEIPADFHVTSGVHLQIDEEHFLEGLRLFADTVGSYPANLAYESLKVELWRSDGARRAAVGPMVLKMFRIRLASDFYGQLVKDGRAVVYHGSSVRPGDGQRVLMRWRVDDDKYRVVFGDLSAHTVDPLRMLELEEQR